MSQAGNAKKTILRTEELAGGHSLIHDRSPVAKLLVTVLYLIAVQSFGKYELSGLVTMLLLPLIAYRVADIELSLCFYKLRFVLPLILIMGVFQPFLDRTPQLCVGAFVITGGMLSMATLVLKGLLSLMASFLLAASTPVTGLCSALDQLHMPRIMTSCLLLCVRYVGTLLEQTEVMWESYSLRAPGQKGIHPKAWGSFLGQLILRSVDKADSLYTAMCLRGFQGSFPKGEMVEECLTDRRSLLYLIGSLCLIFLARFLPLAEWIGGWL
ncbi:MAG: energy-coupling factor transporter transmembrane component T family protein [Acetatifactor sp.]